MKILHLPYTFAPGPCGGTEVYVEALAQELHKLGHEASIAAPGARNETYEASGVPVMRFATSGALSLEALYGDGDILAAQSFEQVLHRFRPDIVHMHAFTPAVSVRVGRLVRERGLPLVFTYHTPTVSCPRGTLMEWGRRDCDGKFDTRRCSRCALHGLGMHRPAAYALGSLPPLAGERLARLGGRTGRAWTVLRMSELVQRHNRAFRELMSLTGHVVAPSTWVDKLLQANGVPSSKITVLRQGVQSTEGLVPPQQAKAPPGPPIRIAFVGRLDRTKGLDVLLEAMCTLPHADVTLDAYGINQGSADAPYLQRLARRVADDPRIALKPPIAVNQVVATLRGYHLLAVPSVWKETGPLVVLEAFAARVPVIGSRLGGIAERVRDGIDGLLVPAGNVSAWVAAIERLLAEPWLLETLRRGVRPARTMADVTCDMLKLYADVTRCPDKQPFRPTSALS